MVWIDKVVEKEWKASGRRKTYKDRDLSRCRGRHTDRVINRAGKGGLNERIKPGRRKICVTD